MISTFYRSMYWLLFSCYPSHSGIWGLNPGEIALPGLISRDSKTFPWERTFYTQTIRSRAHILILSNSNTKPIFLPNPNHTRAEYWTARKHPKRAQSLPKWFGLSNPKHSVSTQHSPCPLPWKAPIKALGHALCSSLYLS